MSLRTKLSAVIVLMAMIMPSARGFAEPAVSLQLVATNLNQPVHVTHAGDGSGRLFIVERAGIVKIFQNGVLLATPFINITSIVGSAGLEQGLLSIAFYPDFDESGKAILSYTDLRGQSVIARYTLSSDNPNKLDPASAEVLLTQFQPFSNHNGGLAQFGPDGYLYFGFGDGGSAGDPTFNGQNTTTLLGSMLRLDVNYSNPSYSIPPDNPFVGDPNARPEIWAFGLRNPWRFDFDELTGDLYIADVGQNRWEEVNFQLASSNGGENYGWNRYEGYNDYRTGDIQAVPPITLIPPKTPYVFPAYSYARSTPHCSVTGGHVYRGQAFKDSLDGAYIFGDYCSGHIWTLRKSGDEWVRNLLITSGVRISSFGEDENGEVYVAHLGLVPDTPGRLYRIVPATP